MHDMVLVFQTQIGLFTDLKADIRIVVDTGVIEREIKLTENSFTSKTSKKKPLVTFDQHNTIQYNTEMPHGAN